MEASEFRPMYDDSVIEWRKDDPNNRPPVNISKYYCLQPTSAKLLAALFTPKPTILMGDPWPTGGPFAYNHEVPLFDFGNGVIRNAGQFALWWGTENGPMPGVPYAKAMDYAQGDIASGPLEGQ